MKCLMCEKPLRLIGADRKNGKLVNNTTGKDWGTRKYHKKCWKEKKLTDKYLQILSSTQT